MPKSDSSRTGRAASAAPIVRQSQGQKRLSKQRRNRRELREELAEHVDNCSNDRYDPRFHSNPDMKVGSHLGGKGTLFMILDSEQSIASPTQPITPGLSEFTFATENPRTPSASIPEHSASPTSIPPSSNGKLKFLEVESHRSFSSTGSEFPPLDKPATTPPHSEPLGPSFFDDIAPIPSPLLYHKESREELQLSLIDGIDSEPLAPVRGQNNHIPETKNAANSLGRTASVAVRLPLLGEELKHKTMERGKIGGLESTHYKMGVREIPNCDPTFYLNTRTYLPNQHRLKTDDSSSSPAFSNPKDCSQTTMAKELVGSPMTIVHRGFVNHQLATPNHPSNLATNMPMALASTVGAEKSSSIGRDSVLQGRGFAISGLKSLAHDRTTADLGELIQQEHTVIKETCGSPCNDMPKPSDHDIGSGSRLDLINNAIRKSIVRRSAKAAANSTWGKTFKETAALSTPPCDASSAAGSRFQNDTQRSDPSLQPISGKPTDKASSTLKSGSTMDIAVCATPTCKALVTTVPSEHDALTWPIPHVPANNMNQPELFRQAKTIHEGAGQQNGVDKAIDWIAQDLGLDKKHDRSCEYINGLLDESSSAKGDVTEPQEQGVTDQNGINGQPIEGDACILGENCAAANSDWVTLLPTLSDDEAGESRKFFDTVAAEQCAMEDEDGWEGAADRYWA